MPKKITVWIKTSFTGFHCFPEAPEEVAYLRDLHRHNFGVKVEYEVTHSDREIEFHLLIEKLKDSVLPSLQFQLERESRMSCEDICEYIISQLPRKNLVSVSVDEDGECGATIRIK